MHYRIKHTLKSILVPFIISLPVATFAGPSSPDITKVPIPIMDEHPGWIDMYYRTFELSFKNVLQKQPGTIFIDYFMDEGFNANIFQWDTSFMMMFGRYSNGELPSIVTLENFYMNQYADGWISRELKEDGTESYWPKDGTETNPALKRRENCSINPPLFSWAEWSDYQISGDKTRFTKPMTGPHVTDKTIFDVLADYFYWIKDNRRHDSGLYWSTSYANGMDNNPRLFLTGVTHGSGLEGEAIVNGVCDHLDASWIDITAQQALNAFYVAKIAGEIGNTERQAEFEKEHAELAQLINDKMWDSNDNFYYDIDREGEFDPVRTPASFWTMIARVSNEDQTQKMVDHIVDPEEFWTLHHIPTVSKSSRGYESDGGYWNGAVWAPTLYETVKGLEVQGHKDLAKKVSVNHIQNLYWVYVDSNSLFENYHQESAHSGFKSKKDFVGWTGVGPIACLIENVMGFHAFGPSDSLDWDLTLAEHHGLENFKFGDNTVTITAEDRLNSDAGAVVTVTTDSPFKLHVTLAGTEYIHELPAGETELMIGKPNAQLTAIPIIHKATRSYGFGASGDETARYQTFKAGKGTILAGVDVKIRRLNGWNQSDVTVDLYATSGGKPTGNALVEGTIGQAEVDNFFVIMHAGMEYDGLVEGTEYAIVLGQKTPKADNYEWVNGEDVDSGLSFGKGDGAGSWTDESALGDAWMKVYAIDTSIEQYSFATEESSSESSADESSADVLSSTEVSSGESSALSSSSDGIDDSSSEDVESSSSTTPLFNSGSVSQKFSAVQAVNNLGTGALQFQVPSSVTTLKVFTIHGALLLQKSVTAQSHIALTEELPQGTLIVSFQ
ncbi:MAG: trehalase family glycosidase [Fibrobacterales bacterium]